jgi:hypothetical protein
MLSTNICLTVLMGLSAWAGLAGRLATDLTRSVRCCWLIVVVRFVKLFVFTVPQPASMPTMFTAFAFEKIQMVDL